MSSTALINRCQVYVIAATKIIVGLFTPNMTSKNDASNIMKSKRNEIFDAESAALVFDTIYAFKKLQNFMY